MAGRANFRSLSICAKDRSLHTGRMPHGDSLKIGIGRQEKSSRPCAEKKVPSVLRAPAAASLKLNVRVKKLPECSRAVFSRLFVLSQFGETRARAPYLSRESTLSYFLNRNWVGRIKINKANLNIHIRSQPLLLLASGKTRVRWSVFINN